LALNIVAETITDLFGGAIGQFLAQDTLVFGSITALLDEQFGRLSALEQTILYRLAIAREPLTLQELQAGLVAPLAAVQLLEAVDGLRRRSLIERGQRVGSFTLQSVVLEYVTAHLVEQLVGEVVQDRLSLLIQHPRSQAKDYVRQTQERLLVAPLLDRLQSVYQGHVEVEQRLRSLLEEVRSWAQDRQGYALANLVTLLGQSAWPLTPMEADSRVGDLMAACGSGTRSWAPPSRMCRILARSTRWLGVRMGTCWSVATSRARCGCGRSGTAGQ